MFLGLFFGGIASGISLTDDSGKWFLVIFPIIGVASFVAYIYQRKLDTISSSDIATQVLTELPDPKNTVEKGKNSEPK